MFLIWLFALSQSFCINCSTYSRGWEFSDTEILDLVEHDLFNVFQNDSNVRVYNDKKRYYDVASQVNHSSKGATVTMGKIEVAGITVWWFQ